MGKGELGEYSAAEAGGSAGSVVDERSRRVKELGDKLNLVREEKEELRKRLGELDKDEAFILGKLEDLKTAAQQDLANIHAAMGATALPSWDSDVYH